jgi:hypothetical protein
MNYWIFIHGYNNVEPTALLNLYFSMKKILFFTQFALITSLSFGQGIQKTMLKLPDTGQTGDFTSTFGEDSDYNINVPFFIKNNNGTVTDTMTGLMWQQADGGEMTIERGNRLMVEVKKIIVGKN